MSIQVILVYDGNDFTIDSMNSLNDPAAFQLMSDALVWIQRLNFSIQGTIHPAQPQIAAPNQYPGTPVQGGAISGQAQQAGQSNGRPPTPQPSTSPFPVDPFKSAQGAIGRP